MILIYYREENTHLKHEKSQTDYMKYLEDFKSKTSAIEQAQAQSQSQSHTLITDLKKKNVKKHKKILKIYKIYKKI